MEKINAEERENETAELGRIVLQYRISRLTFLFMATIHFGFSLATSGGFGSVGMSQLVFFSYPPLIVALCLYLYWAWTRYSSRRFENLSWSRMPAAGILALIGAAAIAKHIGFF